MGRIEIGTIDIIGPLEGQRCSMSSQIDLGAQAYCIVCRTLCGRPDCRGGGGHRPGQDIL